MLERCSVATASSHTKVRTRLTLPALLALLSASMVGAACGQKGPLVLPKAAAAASAASVPAR